MYPQLPYVTFFCLHSVCPLSLEAQLLKKAQLMKEVTWSYFEKVPCDSFNYNVYHLIILFAVQTHQNQITSNTTLTCMCTRTVHTVGTYVYESAQYILWQLPCKMSYVAKCLQTENFANCWQNGQAEFFANRISRMSSTRLHNTKMALSSKHNELSSLVVRSSVVHNVQLTKQSTQ